MRNTSQNGYLWLTMWLLGISCESVAWKILCPNEGAGTVTNECDDSNAGAAEERNKASSSSL